VRRSGQRLGKKSMELQAATRDAAVATRRVVVRSPYRWRWLAFCAVLACAAMDLLDSTVINTAAPSIRADLSGSYAELQWMSAAYTMALAVVLLIGGRLGDMFGRRRMLLIGAAGFTLASMICAVATTSAMLIFARALQGAFGAVMLPQGFGLIRDLFAPAERKRAWTVFGPVMSLSAVLGPIVAGTLIHADLLGSGWRMIFLINVPIGGFALALGASFLPAPPVPAPPVAAPSDPPVPSARLDPLGVVLAAAGTFMLIFPLVQGRELGWPWWTVAVLAGSVPVLAGFGWHQLRQQRSGVTPLIETSMFGRRSYASGLVFAVVFSAAVGGTLLTLSVFLQVGLGYTPLRAGLTSMPWALGAMAGSGASGALMARLGRRLLQLGLTGMGAGLIALYAVLGYAGTSIGSADFAAPLLIGGIGMGMIFAPMFDIVLRDVADQEVGSASSVLQAVQQLGASLGVAVIGTAFFGLLGLRAPHNFEAFAAPRLRAELTAAAVPAASRSRVIAGVRACVQDSEGESNPDIRPASCRIPGLVAIPTAAQSTATRSGMDRAMAAAGRDTHRRDSLAAARTTVLITLILIVLAFGIGFMLPASAPAATGGPTS
jgi:EmrB/QacA subfamily drug resistance transporter